MKKDPQSHNTAVSKSLRQTFVPGLGQVVIYILLGFITLSILNIGVLWNYLNNSVGVSQESANTVIQGQFDRFSDFTSGLFEGRLAPMLFWAFLGIVTYMIVWLIQNTTTNIRNDVIAEHYKHPSAFSRQRYWQSVAAYKIFLVCSSLFCLAFIYLSLEFWLPILSRVFYTSIYNWQPLSSTWKLIAAVLVTAFIIYVAVLLVKITRNTWRWVTNNL